jgi:hypothetical protein
MTMNGYVAFYDRKRIEVHADTMSQAIGKAVAEFQKGTRKKVRSGEVAIALAEREGEQVTHNPSILPGS